MLIPVVVIVPAVFQVPRIAPTKDKVEAQMIETGPFCPMNSYACGLRIVILRRLWAFGKVRCRVAPGVAHKCGDLEFEGIAFCLGRSLLMAAWTRA
ncbi:MAG: hypothetical protein M2R45_01061 [Verrucomicrobia subdivision 3 bacterium]|nr:hypothetical protein [Limisphaerales bacterium]MCS1414173.1 hypothetical protein [Limisphaerales bacterium]